MLCFQAKFTPEQLEISQLKFWKLPRDTEILYKLWGQDLPKYGKWYNI